MLGNTQRYVVAGLVVAALVVSGAAYFKGRMDGDAMAQAAARKQIVEQLTERNRINESVSRMSSADLCRRLGGVFVDNECQ